MNNNYHKPSPNPLLLLGLGVAAGWLAKKFFESPEMRQRREEAMIRLEDFRDQVMDSDEAAHLEEAFGNVTDDLRDLYDVAQKKLVKEFAAVKTTWANLDKDRYMDAVSDVVSDLREDKEVSEETIDKIQTALKDDFKKLQKNRVGNNRGRSRVANKK